MTDEKTQRGGIFFEGRGQDLAKQYPAWRYHALYEPLVVENTEEDEDAYRKGWREPNIPVTAVQNFQNFYHDLEDMNERQLIVYAREEYGAELPEGATKAKLLHAIWEMAMVAPKNKGRIVLLAQTVKMDLDAVHEKILEMAGDLESCSEITKEEVWL